jgi:hypothetical protein
VREAKQSDRLLQQVRDLVLECRTREFTIDGIGAVRFHRHLCVPQKSQVKEDILREAHRTSYTIHPGDKDLSRPEKDLLVKKNERLI